LPFNSPKKDTYIKMHKDKKNSNYEDRYIYYAKKKRKKREKCIKILIFVLSFLCLGSGSGILYFHNIFNSINFDNSKQKDFNLNNDNINNNDSEETKKIDLMEVTNYSLLQDPMILNVALLGVDKHDKNEHGRSDTIILLSVDSRRKKLKLTSILRDIFAKIPGHGMDRLNSAYSYGGAKLAVDTLEANFGIKVDRYCQVDFSSFADIIEVLGGIDIELTASECKFINEHLNLDKYNRIPETPGMKHLNGWQALFHSRNRDSTGSDFDRTTRQRTVLKIILDKMKSSDIFKINKIISEVGPKITTNFHKDEVLKLTGKILNYINYPVSEYKVPQTDNMQDVYKGKMLVLEIPDMNKMRYELAKFIYEDSVKIKSN